MWHAWERREKYTRKEREYSEYQARFRWDQNGGIGWVGVGWIQVAQDRGQWWALVNMVVNHRVLAPQS
jgi:hypothetical protein